MDTEIVCRLTKAGYSTYVCSICGRSFHKRNMRKTTLAKPATSPAVLNAISILDSFSSETPALSLSELSRRLEIPKASLFRNLNALEHGGYLSRNAGDGRYSLGVKVLDLANRFSRKDRFLSVGGVHTRELSRATGETSHLAILDGADIVYVDVAEGSQMIRAVVGRGDRLPAHCVASGKAILAYASRATLMDFLAHGLKSFTPQTFVSSDELLKDLETTRRRGYATNLGEWVDGVAAVAAPVFGQENVVVGAIGIAGPRLRLGNKMLAYLASAIQEQAERLSKELGGAPPSLDVARFSGERRKRLIPAE